MSDETRKATYIAALAAAARGEHVHVLEPASDFCASGRCVPRARWRGHSPDVIIEDEVLNAD